MRWARMLENWQTALSKRLGRTAEDILENNLLATDFSDDSVRVQFEDGTNLNFRCAFYVGETPDDGAIHWVAVFTEHCGYHEFWIDPASRISASPEPKTGYQFDKDNLAWDAMAHVGREFGSPDYDRLMNQDAKKFASDLARWIQRSARTYGSLDLEPEDVSDARNIQLALRQLGQEVTLEVAASV
jgi:hypothetical protein